MPQRRTSFILLRFLLIMSGVGQALMKPTIDGIMNIRPDPSELAFAFGGGIVAILVVVGFQAFNPWTAAHWFRPAWDLNPLNLRQPVQFGHLAAHFIVAVGATDLFAAYLRHQETNLGGCIPLSVGMGMWVGTRMLPSVFRKKFSSDNWHREKGWS